MACEILIECKLAASKTLKPQMSKKKILDGLGLGP